MTAQRHFIFWALAFASFLALVYLFSAVLLPFVLGIVIAYLLNPLVNYMGRWKVGRGPAAFAIVLLFITLVIAAVSLVLPILCAEIIQLSHNIPEYYERLRMMVEPATDRLQAFLGKQDAESVQTMVTENAATAAGFAATIAGGLASGGAAILSLISLFIITPFVTFYMMKEWTHITRWATGLIPRHSEHQIMNLFRDIDRKLSGFIRGQALVALFLGVTYAIALSLVGLNYGFLIGFTSGLLSIIPMVGSITGFVVGVLVAWLQTGEINFVIVVAAIFITGQIIEGNFLTPKIVGDRVGLHPLWIFFALMAGAALLGFLGMLIAVPVAAVISVLAAFGIKRYKASVYYKGAR